MDILSNLTIIAALAASSSWFVQAVKLHKNKSSDDVSLTFLLTMFSSLFLFTLYGWRDQDMVVFIPFLIGVIGVSTVLFLYFKYRKKKK
jgi:uncharacterized protein with PQ loop repeat